MDNIQVFLHILSMIWFFCKNVGTNHIRNSYIITTVFCSTTKLLCLHLVTSQNQMNGILWLYTITSFDNNFKFVFLFLKKAILQNLILKNTDIAWHYTIIYVSWWLVMIPQTMILWKQKNYYSNFIWKEF